MLFISLNVWPISAQRVVTKKPTRPVTERLPVPPLVQTDDQEAAIRVEKLLNQSGQKYTRLGMGAWIIRRNGQNLRYFQIVLSHRSGTLITQVTVATAKSLQVNEAAPNLLRLANKLDYVKVGLDTGDDLFVRNEARLKSLDLEEFTNNLDRVAAAADLVYAGVRR